MQVAQNNKIKPQYSDPKVKFIVRGLGILAWRPQLIQIFSWVWVDLSVVTKKIDIFVSIIRLKTTTCFLTKICSQTKTKPPAMMKSTWFISKPQLIILSVVHRMKKLKLMMDKICSVKVWEILFLIIILSQISIYWKLIRKFLKIWRKYMILILLGLKRNIQICPVLKRKYFITSLRRNNRKRVLLQTYHRFFKTKASSILVWMQQSINLIKNLRSSAST